MFTTAEAQFIAIFIESICYGFYISTMIGALGCIFHPELDGTQWRKPGGIRLVTLIISLVLFINCSLNLVWGFIPLVQTYIFHEVKKPSYWITMARPFNVTIQTLIADIFLIYRCWVIYHRSLIVIIFPTLAWLAGTALTIFILFIRTRGSLEVGKPNGASTPILASQWGTTIAVNIYATAFIVYKIYVTVRDSNRLISESQHLPNMKRDIGGQTQLQRLMRILVESGLLYTVVSISAFLSVVTESNAIFITSAVDIVVVGVTFNQIIIRLSKERTRERRLTSVEPQLATMQFGQNRATSVTQSSTSYYLRSEYDVNAVHVLPEETKIAV